MGKWYTDGSIIVPYLADMAVAKGRNGVHDGEVALPLQARGGLVLLHGKVHVQREATPAVPTAMHGGIQGSGFRV